MKIVCKAKATCRTTRITNGIRDKHFTIAKDNAFSAHSGTPELVLDKSQPLSFLRGIIRTDFGKVERTNFRSKG